MPTVPRLQVEAWSLRCSAAYRPLVSASLIQESLSSNKVFSCSQQLRGAEHNGLEGHHAGLDRFVLTDTKQGLWLSLTISNTQLASGAMLNVKEHQRPQA